MIEIRTNIASLIAILEEIQKQKTFNVEEVFADALIEALVKYPRPNGAPQPFTSPRQRRGFFAALKSKKITVPYRRTQTLMRGWRKQRIQQKIVVVNDTPYTSLVQGTKREQSAYHRSWWKSYNDVAEEVSRTVVPEMEKSILQAIDAIISRPKPMRKP
jgi:hypothetical protein